ncbi:MAG: MBL fold metallo-hydrolase [Clostridia bacterium]|nr:MBL fold metallo-hydrolase [Clostridia bacterium]
MKKLLCLTLALLLLAGTLVACKSDKEEENPTESGTDTVTVGDPVTEYALVRAATADKYLVKAVTALKKDIDAAAGGEIELKDDHLTGDETADNDNREILIGKTNRPESIAVYEELGDSYKFIIRQVENKLVVAAPTTELLKQAIEYLTANYLQNAGNGTYPFGTDISYTGAEQSYLELVTKKELNYDIVYPSAASALFKNEVTAVSNALKTVAKTAPEMITDASSAVDSKKAIVLGPVNLPGVSDMVNELPYLSYQVVKSGNKMFFLGRDDATMITLCEKLVEQIACGKYADGTVRISVPGKDAEFVHDWADTIPAFPENGGTLHSVAEFAEGLYRIYITGTTEDQYNAYEQILEDNGYKMYSVNKIGSNLYRTYKGSECMIHMYFNNTKREIRILAGDVDEMVDYDLAPVTDGTIIDPSWTLLAPDYSAQPGGENGMGLIFTMKDGSFVIVDGGWGYDTKGLYDYLVANNRRDDGILIRAWIITHPHEDHYGNVVKFSNSYASKVKVEKFVAQFAVGPYAVNGSADDDIAIILPALEKFEGAELLVPQVGQKMYFGELEMEFLYTVECLYPAANIGDANNHSLCAKMNFYGKDILMMGDSFQAVCNYLVNTYGSYIQSDYLQVPHHNGNGGNSNFYQTVRPSTILVTTTQSKYDRTVANSDEPLYFLVKSLSCVKNVYVADNGYKTIK